MAHIYSIRNILEIKDENIQIENKTTEEIYSDTKCIIFYGTLTYTPAGCMNCGIVNESHADIVKNGTKTSTIEYCGRFLPALRFFLPLIAEDFTTPCGEVYQLNLSCS